MSMLEKYAQELEDLGSIQCGSDDFESSMTEIMIQYQLKPMRKEFLKGYADFSKKFTYKELRKIALKSCAYYSPMRDSVFLLITKLFHGQGICTTVIDIDDYKTFIDLRNDPCVEIS